MCTCTSDTREEAGMPCLHTKSHPEMIISKRRSGLVYVSAPSLSHTGKARIVSVYDFVICNMASSLLHNCHLCTYYICVQSHNKAIFFLLASMRVHSVHHFVAIIHFVATSRFGFVFLNDSLVKNEGKSSRHRERERKW